MWIKKNIKGLECWDTTEPFKDLYYKVDNIDQVVDILNNNVVKENIVRYDEKNKEYVMRKEIDNDVGEVLPSGIYRLKRIEYNDYLVTESLGKKSEVLNLKINEDILKDFNTFKESKQVYKDLEMSHKRGVLLYGPPGTGKTSIINKLVSQLNTEDTLVFFLNDVLDLKFIHALKEDSRFKIMIFEEFTNQLHNGELDGDMLDFLDGETSLDNSFIIASTNYPEQLPKNVTDRPGRFDKFYLLASPGKEDVHKYFNAYGLKLTDEQVELLFGKTLAEFKEILLLNKRDGRTLEEAIELMTKQKDLVHVDFDSKNRMGFVL